MIARATTIEVPPTVANCAPKVFAQFETVTTSDGASRAHDGYLARG
jgi:hypothetical protein